MMVAGVLLGGFLAAVAADGQASFTRIDGKVFVRPAGATSESPGRLGESLTSGTALRSEGTAELTFKDGTTLRMQPGTRLLLSPAKRDIERKNSVLLFFGRVWSKVVKATNDGPNYEVQTANAVAGVRGTEFEVSVADDGSARVQVSDGAVQVGAESGAGDIARKGQQVEADEKALGAVGATGGADDNAWRKDKRERLRKDGSSIVKAMQGKVTERQQKIEALRAEQTAVQAKIAAATERLQGGDDSAADELRALKREMQRLAKAIADLGDAALAQLGYVDRVAELAADPRFKMINAKTVAADAKNLLRVRDMLEKFVADGTNISMEAMDKMLDDMSNGRGSLKDKKGSTTKDLFGDDDMKMK